MDHELLQTLQDQYDEISRRAGIGPNADQRISDAMTILLAGHNITPQEFKRLIEEKIAREFSYPVMLRFKDKFEANRFMAQLSDGWGENYCTLVWPYETGSDFEDVDTFGVDILEEDDE